MRIGMVMNLPYPHPILSPVVAVDGGGTTCRIACVSAQGRCVVEVGPANVSSDYDGALGRLRDGIAELASHVTGGAEALYGAPAYLGLAGVASPRIAARVAADLPFQVVRVEDDRHPALAGAHGDADGAIAHCGTGSFLALQAGEARRFAGGWGPVLGDEASAQWIGRRALAVALNAHDGLAEQSDLTRRLLADYDGTGGIVAFAAEAPPHELGQIARRVTAAAQAGDVVGQGLMREGAAYLWQALGAMGWTPQMALCLTGGIGPLYAPYLPPEAQAAIVAPKGAPIEGAIALAYALQKEQTQ